MNLAEYLARINYHGPLDPTQEVLFALHRAHLTSIAYENLDIHLGTSVTVDPEHIFDKIVRRGRGGWCFEMNGLFAWVLREIGFDVTMYAATVGRANRKDPELAVGRSTEPTSIPDVREGDHLVLKVVLEQPYLADVGFGVGFYDPLPLASGRYTQDIIEVSLRFEENRWHFDNASGSGPGYDFPLEPQTLADFGEACDWLQTSPDSGFVQTTVCQLVQPQKLLTLRGALLTTTRPAGVTTQVIEDGDEYTQLIKEGFGLPIDGLGELWDRVWAKHQRWVEENPGVLG